MCICICNLKNRYRKDAIYHLILIINIMHISRQCMNDILYINWLSYQQCNSWLMQSTLHALYSLPPASDRPSQREKERFIRSNEMNNGSSIPSIHLFIHPFMLSIPIHYHLMHAVSLYAWSPLCRHLHRRLWAPIEAQHVWASTLWSSCDLPRPGLSAAVRWIDRRYNECRGCLMITMIRVDHENNCGSDNCDDNDDDCGSINN
jgi:hypothetical protein